LKLKDKIKSNIDIQLKKALKGKKWKGFT
jgi:hypothetical protein